MNSDVYNNYSRLVIKEEKKARSRWESNPGSWLEPPVLYPVVSIKCIRCLFEDSLKTTRAFGRNSCFPLSWSLENPLFPSF